MFVPRSGADPNAPAEDPAAAQAAALEAANARIAELEGLSEEKIRIAAEELVTEVFPAIRVPEPESRVAQQPPDDGGEYPQAEAPTNGEPDRLAQVADHVTELEIQMRTRELNEDLDRLSVAYPHMNRYLVLGQLAQSKGQANINKLAEISHNVEFNKLDTYYKARVASELGTAPTPPPIPGNPVATPTPGDKITPSNAATVLAQRLAARLGWKG